MTILRTLENAGFEAYLVGGCVRDSIMGRTPQDFDITTNARPEQVIKIFDKFRTVPTGIKHGTVTVISNGEPFEVTTFRVDGNYSDSRRPDSVSFTSNLTEDLARRDFTVNAMAMDVRGKIYDPFGGKSDIENKIIKCVGEPEKRFEEDALRIMRALRFSSQLGFEIEKSTSETLLKLRENLDKISRERVREELDKLICGKDVIRVMMDYREVIAQVIPEIRECFDFEQHSVYHKYDVYEHTVRAVGIAEELPLKRVMLLHDIAKPRVFRLDKNGRGHFKMHSEVGAKIAEKILKNLRYDNKTIKQTVLLIAHHSDNIHTERDVKYTISEIGAENFFSLMKVKRADNSAKHSFVLRELEEFEELEKTAMRLIEDGACMTLRQLAVKGNDISELGFGGVRVGEILKKLLELVMDGKISNDRERLLEYVRGVEK